MTVIFRSRIVLPLALGVIVLALVLAHFDLGAVKAALVRAGWGGFAVVVLAGLAAEVALAVGLVPLLPRPMPLAAVIASRARAIASSTGTRLGRRSSVHARPRSSSTACAADKARAWSASNPPSAAIASNRAGVLRGPSHDACCAE